MDQACIASRSWNQERIEKFEYPAMPFNLVRPATLELEATAEEGTRGCKSHDNDVTPTAVDAAQKLDEETRRAFAAGHERGLLEGRQVERDAHAAVAKAAADQHMQQAAQLIGEFARERDQYLHTVEKEVVKLALAVAARILRREAQMDPLLLTGAVRVALGQLSGSTEVRLRVPESELDLWQDAVALLPNLSVKPKVIAGEAMRLGDCLIETALGSVDLGVRSQLGEIERGFFDSTVKSKTCAPATHSGAETVVTNR